MSVGNSNEVVDGLFNFDGGNAMLAAIISLLIVILFIIILHIYAKWFLAHRHHHHHHHHHRISHLRSWAALLYDDDDDDTHSSFSSFSAADGKGNGGLDPSTIAAIPLFVFDHDNECVICLGNFEEAEVGRRLPSCEHGFHIECIDMWLHSHTTCPICRSPVLVTHRSSSSSLSRSEEAVDQENQYEELRPDCNNLIEMGAVIEVRNHDTGNDDDYDQLPPGAVTTCSDDCLGSSSSNVQGTSFVRMLSCRNNVNNNTSSELNSSSGAASTSTAAIA